MPFQSQKSTKNFIFEPKIENWTFSFWICSACCFSFCLISFSYVVVFFKPVILSSNVFAWPFLVQNVYFLEIGSFYSENVVKMAHFPTKNSKNDSSIGNFPIFVQKNEFLAKMIESKLITIPHPVHLVQIWSILTVTGTLSLWSVTVKFSHLKKNSDEV